MGKAVIILAWLLSAVIGPAPKAFGLHHTEAPDKNPLEDIRWGLRHGSGEDRWRTDWNHIKRFHMIENE